MTRNRAKKCPDVFEVGQKFAWEAKGKVASATVTTVTESILMMDRILNDEKQNVIFDKDSLKDKLKSGIVIWIREGENEPEN
jgi:hypothetical protein